MESYGVNEDKDNPCSKPKRHRGFTVEENIRWWHSVAGDSGKQKEERKESNQKPQTPRPNTPRDETLPPPNTGQKHLKARERAFSEIITRGRRLTLDNNNSNHQSLESCKAEEKTKEYNEDHQVVKVVSRMLRNLCKRSSLNLRPVLSPAMVQGVVGLLHLKCPAYCHSITPLILRCLLVYASSASASQLQQYNTEEAWNCLISSLYTAEGRSRECSGGNVSPLGVLVDIFNKEEKLQEQSLQSKENKKRQKKRKMEKLYSGAILGWLAEHAPSEQRDALGEHLSLCEKLKEMWKHRQSEENYPTGRHDQEISKSQMCDEDKNEGPRMTTVSEIWTTNPDNQEGNEAISLSPCKSHVQEEVGMERTHPSNLSVEQTVTENEPQSCIGSESSESGIIWQVPEREETVDENSTEHNNLNNLTEPSTEHEIDRAHNVKEDRVEDELSSGLQEQRDIEIVETQLHLQYLELIRNETLNRSWEQMQRRKKILEEAEREEDADYYRSQKKKRAQERKQKLIQKKAEVESHKQYSGAIPLSPQTTPTHLPIAPSSCSSVPSSPPSSTVAPIPTRPSPFVARPIKAPPSRLHIGSFPSCQSSPNLNLSNLYSSCTPPLSTRTRSPSPLLSTRTRSRDEDSKLWKRKSKKRLSEKILHKTLLTDLLNEGSSITTLSSGDHNLVRSTESELSARKDLELNRNTIRREQVGEGQATGVASSSKEKEKDKRSHRLRASTSPATQRASKRGDRDTEVEKNTKEECKNVTEVVPKVHGEEHNGGVQRNQQFVNKERDIKARSARLHKFFGEQYVDFEEGLQNPSSVNTQYASQPAHVRAYKLNKLFGERIVKVTQEEEEARKQAMNTTIRHQKVANTRVSAEHQQLQRSKEEQTPDPIPVSHLQMQDQRVEEPVASCVDNSKSTGVITSPTGNSAGFSRRRNHRLSRFFGEKIDEDEVRSAAEKGSGGDHLEISLDAVPVCVGSSYSSNSLMRKCKSTSHLDHVYKGEVESMLGGSGVSRKENEDSLKKRVPPKPPSINNNSTALASSLVP